MRKTVMALGLGLAMAVVAARPGSASDLLLPPILGDHMVLQQGIPVRLWGQDKPGQEVAATMAGSSTKTKADAKGHWSLTLPAIQAGGPFELSIQGSEKRVITDVLVGEVWLGSGQSNMEFAMRSTSDQAAEIPKATNPKIRLFTVERAAAGTPQTALKGSWKLCSPETVPDFSAVAYHFGKQLQARLKVPVGMIAASWGGTPAEDWIPRQVMDKDPELSALIKGWDQDPGRLDLWTKGEAFELQVKDMRLIPKAKGGKALALGKGLEWTHNEMAGSSGSVAPLKQGGPGLLYRGIIHGGAWGGASADLKKDGSLDLSPYEAIELSVKGHGKFRLALGQPSITDSDLYSSEVFSTGDGWQKVTVPLSSLKQGGWGQAKPFTPDSIRSLMFGVQVAFWPDLASSTYNGMIAPLTSFPIKGVLWYQGESNAGRAKLYQKTLSLLIRSWREAWGLGEFPFLVVQLPNFQKGCAEPCESEWAALREAQRLTVRDVPHTALACVLDQGEANDIHPKFKTEVGRRLALAALNIAYGKKTEYSGPEISKVERAGGRLKIEFKHLGKGLTLKSGSSPLGFEVAGEDRKFKKAKATIQGGSVLMGSAEVKAPRHARYAWSDNPEFNLYNKDGFPALPFEASLP